MQSPKSSVSGIKNWLLPLFTWLFILSPVFLPEIHAQNAVKKSSQKVRKVLYGQASFYSNKFHGRKTASGEIFSQQKLTCACNVLPFGTWVKVTNLRNRKSVIVKVNDRLHPKMKRVVDLTRKAAVSIGMISSGLTRVKVEVIGRHKPKN